jgi:PAS domain S-box-containing protein
LALEASSRVRAQAELAQSEQKYHRVIDLSREGFWLINGRNETIEVNSALCQMLGYAKEEMLGRTPLEFVDADNRSILERRLVPHPVPAAANYELVLTRKDGTKVSTMYNATAVFNANGEREFSFAFVTDITERKLLDAELRRALTERDAILHSSLVGIAFVKDSRYVWVNKTYEQDMLGYEERELGGQPTALTYSSPEHFERIRPEILAALAKEGVYRMEARVKRKDGSLLWCLVSGRALDPGNLSAGSIWTLADIGQRKAAEAELVQALSREKELNELKSRFISMTSHEFRTPLAAILSSTELLADYGERLPPGEKEELLGLIKDAVRRMTHMLEDVLFIGKSEAGRLEFRPYTLKLRAFCERLVEEFRSFMGRHNELYLELNGEDRAYVLDAELLRHILGNLLSNAVKYSPERTPVDLRVMCHKLGVRFTVVDRGIGIPANDRPLLFQTFHRGRNVGNVAGTGLGLAIVKTAVDLHGGTIRVDSQPGRGTRVTVDLPETGAVAND